MVAPDSMLGTSAIVKITSVGRWSVFGEVIEVLNCVNQETASTNRTCLDEASACSTTCDACSCSKEADPCACGAQSCEEKTVEEATLSRNDTWEDKTTSLIGWLLRKRRNRVKKRQESEIGCGHNSSQELVSERRVEWGGIDRALLGGMLVSLLTIVALVMHLGARVST